MSYLRGCPELRPLPEPNIRPQFSIIPLRRIIKTRNKMENETGKYGIIFPFGTICSHIVPYQTGIQTLLESSSEASNNTSGPTAR